MGTCFPAFVQTPPPSIMLSISRSAVIGSAMLALASAESLSPPFLQTALEVVSRASSSSEVLSLNLTNLIILLALKVAIVAFGLFSGGATGRSDSPHEITKEELTGGMCFLLYTAGDVSKMSCIKRAACERPYESKQLLSASKMWYNIHKVLNVVPFDSEMKPIMDHVAEAINHGEAGDSCSAFEW